MVVLKTFCTEKEICIVDIRYVRSNIRYLEHLEKIRGLDMTEGDSLKEMRRYFESIEVKQLAVTTLKTALFRPSFAEMMTEILTLHSVTIEVKEEYCLIVFSEVTYKTGVLPRTQAERYTITLPDGFELHESKMRANPYSYLQLDINRLLPLQQEALRDVDEQKDCSRPRYE